MGIYMAELIEPLPNEFPEDRHNMDDDSDDNLLDISEPFNMNDITNTQSVDDTNMNSSDDFGDETTLPDETRGSINISQYSHVSQGSLHPSHLQGGKRRKKNSLRKKEKTNKRKNGK